MWQKSIDFVSQEFSVVSCASVLCESGFFSSTCSWIGKSSSTLEQGSCKSAVTDLETEALSLVKYSYNCNNEIFAWLCVFGEFNF